MKLTTARLKRLIREELEKLNEGSATIVLLVAYLAYLNKQEQSTNQSNLPVKKKNEITKRKNIVTAVLLLHSVAIILGAIMENLALDPMDSENLEDRVMRSFYNMDVMEAQSILDELGIMDISADEILSTPENELMMIMNEYDPIGYYQQRGN